MLRDDAQCLEISRLLGLPGSRYSSFGICCENTIIQSPSDDLAQNPRSMGLLHVFIMSRNEPDLKDVVLSFCSNVLRSKLDGGVPQYFAWECKSGGTPPRRSRAGEISLRTLLLTAIN